MTEKEDFYGDGKSAEKILWVVHASCESIPNIAQIEPLTIEGTDLSTAQGATGLSRYRDGFLVAIQHATRWVVLSPELKPSRFQSFRTFIRWLPEVTRFFLPASEEIPFFHTLPVNLLSLFGNTRMGNATRSTLI